MPDGPSIDLYGIVNCDQVKKARAWLDAAGIDYRFHDFKKEPPSAALIGRWLKKAGWETLVNRRGTTWRALPEGERPTSDKEALGAIQSTPTLVKRPVITVGDVLLIGFDEQALKHTFAK
jgi:arsenate reductase (glutaredoxin)